VIRLGCHRTGAGPAKRVITCALWRNLLDRGRMPGLLPHPEGPRFEAAFLKPQPDEYRGRGSKYENHLRA